MTTTNTFSGFGEDERKSSRVLRPPGGGSSNIFGSEPAAEPAKPTKPYLKDAGLFGSNESSPKKTETRSAAGDEKKDDSHNKLFGDTPPQKPAKAQVGFNPITGKAYESKDENEPPAGVPSSPSHSQGRATPTSSAPYATEGVNSAEKNIPSTRVRQPPGGASTKLW